MAISRRNQANDTAPETMRVPRRALLTSAGPIGLLASLGLAGCTSPTGGESPTVEAPSPEANVRKTGRKGIGLTADDAAGIKKLQLLNVDWSYDWGSAYPPVSTGVEFVPMIWSKRNLQSRLEEVSAGIPVHRPAALLGFNEPDYRTQANMTVDEAIAAWPALQAVNLRLGSPAAALPSDHWLDEFMTKAEANNLRVDFMTFHSYQEPNPESFLRKVTELYEAYGKPVWITEFAVADWGATPDRPSRYTMEQVQDYMTATVQGLRERSYVERFAWHTNKTTDPVVGPSALFHEDGSLTGVGETYSAL